MNEILRFLSELEEHNSLEWMHANKARCQEALRQFEALLEELLPRLAEFDAAVAGLSVKGMTGRLNRDTRFSKDKSPYRPAFRAHISPGGRAPAPVGYFLHAAPGRLFLGGGLYVGPGMNAFTEGVRTAITSHSAEFEAIVRGADFAACYELTGERLQRLPRGYAKDAPGAEYLRYKSFEIESRLPDEALDCPSAFCDLAAERFRLAKPFNDFINRAVEGIPLPARP